MILEEWVERLERQVLDFGKRLLPGNVRQAWRDEVEQLRMEVNEQHAHALHFREAVQQLHHRLAENEIREAVLASHVETYIHTREQAKAYYHALELDQVRRQLAEDRARLPHEQKAYQMHRARIAELERRLAELRRKLEGVLAR